MTDEWSPDAKPGEWPPEIEPFFQAFRAIYRRDDLENRQRKGIAAVVALVREELHTEVLDAFSEIRTVAITGQAYAGGARRGAQLDRWTKATSSAVLALWNRAAALSERLADDERVHLLRFGQVVDERDDLRRRVEAVRALNDEAHSDIPSFNGSNEILVHKALGRAEGTACCLAALTPPQAPKKTEETPMSNPVQSSKRPSPEALAEALYKGMTKGDPHAKPFGLLSDAEKKRLAEGAGDLFDMGGDAVLTTIIQAVPNTPPPETLWFWDKSRIEKDPEFDEPMLVNWSMGRSYHQDQDKDMAMIRKALAYLLAITRKKAKK